MGLLVFAAVFAGLNVALYLWADCCLRNVKGVSREAELEKARKRVNKKNSRF